MKNQLYSEGISRFIKFLEAAKAEYARCEEELNYQDHLKTDYLHLLELKCTCAKNRNKISKRLQQCLVERRKCKDTLAILEPLIQFLESDKGKQLINQLPQLVGRIRKEEKRIVDRTYAPRAMTVTEYECAVKENETDIGQDQITREGVIE